MAHLRTQIKHRFIEVLKAAREAGDLASDIVIEQTSRPLTTKRSVQGRVWVSVPSEAYEQIDRNDVGGRGLYWAFPSVVVELDFAGTEDELNDRLGGMQVAIEEARWTDDLFRQIESFDLTEMNWDAEADSADESYTGILRWILRYSFIGTDPTTISQ